MSYILDALRKADAERERGSVPGLHTQAVPPVSPERAAPRRGVPVAWVAGGAALVVAGALAWTWSGRGGDTPSEPVRAIEAPPPVAAAVAPPPVAPAPAPAPVAAAPAPVPAPTPVAPAPAPATVALAPATAPVVAPPSPPPVPVKPARAVAKAAAPHHAAAASAMAPAAPAASAAEAKVHAVSELPPELRREWPQLSIGGSIYSETPASRFLIINGQIYHEGDALPNGLTLEQIKLKAAVLRWRGYRVGITF